MHKNYFANAFEIITEHFQTSFCALKLSIKCAARGTASILHANALFSKDERRPVAQTESLSICRRCAAAAAGWD